MTTDRVADLPGLAPRRAALRILERAGKGLPLDAALELSMKGLEGPDRRLAHELAAGVLRRQTELDSRLAAHVPRGLGSVPPLIRGVLRLGVYQLDELDRVPAHAAVSTSVDLAREVAGAKAAGFVNAVLRKAGEAHRAVGAVDTPLPDSSASSTLSARYSHPLWLVERWFQRFGMAGTAALLEWNNRRPALVVQPGRESEAQIRSRFEEHRIEFEAAPLGAGLIVTGRSPTNLPGYTEGAFIVQDPAQALVVRFADFPSDAMVYDACAAPGGKTIAMGRRVRSVIAGEARPSRLPRLAENLSRAGSGAAFIVAADASRPPLAQCSAVLLDAPCLGTGTFARHPDARWKVNLEALDRLRRRQADLLTACAALIPPGGLLIYSTCSLEPEENAEQIDRFLTRSPEFRREPPSGVPLELLSDQGDLELLPQRHGMDGAFAARLRRIA
ncbi:MAG TPA: transcription antitermination factor NusB [Gemmatimonadales bacterium]|nr:transcription antitermination factor NusB [Gemmatimonadales bacterium]